MLAKFLKFVKGIFKPFRWAYIDVDVDADQYDSAFIREINALGTKMGDYYVAPGHWADRNQTMFYQQPTITAFDQARSLFPTSIRELALYLWKNRKFPECYLIGYTTTDDICRTGKPIDIMHPFYEWDRTMKFPNVDASLHYKVYNETPY